MDKTSSTWNLLPPLTLWQAALLAAVAAGLLLAARAWFGPPLGPSRRPVLWLLRGALLLALVAILANPVRVDRSPGPLRRCAVSYLLDCSASMALGESSSRFGQALAMMQQVDRLLPPEKRPELNLYRFGQRLVAVGRVPPDADGIAPPADQDTRLLSALRQLAGRFLGLQHHEVVLFSDGRTRQAADVLEMARRYRQLGVPIHVVPLGQTDRGGDVAVISMVAPARVRKHARVGVTVWVRSYGYQGRRTQLRLEGVSRPGQPRRLLAQLPITLTDGIQSFQLAFQSDLRTTHIEASVPLQAGEVSTSNNAAAADVVVDRTKIRVLYVEGARQQLRRRLLPGGRLVTEGPHTPLYNALSQDPDIECVPLVAVGDPVGLRNMAGGSSTFPGTRAQLFAYDVIILSDVDCRQFADAQLKLIERWIGQRGGGLCMVGGPRSFGDGGWSETVIAGMLPVSWSRTGGRWSAGGPLHVQIEPAAIGHPIWNIVSDAAQNRKILASLPDFSAWHRGLVAKQTARVLAIGRAGGTSVPVLTVASYGKGRTMAMAVSLNAQRSPDFTRHWGQGDNRYFAKFWRNAVYWLTENSYLGRRRLEVASDKMSYQPGQTIQLRTRAFDETSQPTTRYRVTAMIVPRSLDADLTSEYAPVRWPDGVRRAGDETSPYVLWGEELDMTARPDDDGYRLQLPLADRLSGGASSEALRVEVSAYEEQTLIDSTSIDVQLLDDPFEYRNPLPDVALLRRIAEVSGGQTFADAKALAAMLRSLPIEAGPEEVRKVPLWSRWWLLGLLLVLLSAEWAWRRSVGLA